MATQTVFPESNWVSGTIGSVNPEFAYDGSYATHAQQYGIYPYVGGFVGYALGGTKSMWADAIVEISIASASIGQGECATVKMTDDNTGRFSDLEIGSLYFGEYTDIKWTTNLPGWNPVDLSNVYFTVETSARTVNTQAIINIADIRVIGTIAVPAGDNDGKKSAAASW